MRSAGFKRGESKQLHLLPEIDRVIREADTAQFRGTTYETLQPLLRTMKLPSGHWVEPCAGDGDILDHVARAAREGLTSLPSYWTAIELRESPTLVKRADHFIPGDLASAGICAIDRQDFLAWKYSDPSVSLVLTNWPWYGIAPLVEHAWMLYPNADVVGLCCAREPLDGKGNNSRPAWFAEHAPDWYLCHGRQLLTCMGSGTPTNGYPHPVAWLYWPRDGRNRTIGTWQVLPPYSGPRSAVHVAFP